MDAIAYPLNQIFRKSLDEGTLPDSWKVGRIAAIFKKGNRKLASNYRPVSLTSVTCKIMESFIRDSIITHMLHNNLFSEHQYGFMSGKSTTLQLLIIIEEWSKWLEDQESIDVCYLDFKKAFDSVPHTRLLMKLHSYGIRGNSSVGSDLSSLVELSSLM